MRKSQKIQIILMGIVILCFTNSFQMAVATPSMSFTDLPAGYETWSTVTYQLDYKWRAWSTSNNVNVKAWFSRFTNHSQPQLTGVAPIQMVEVLDNTSTTPNAYYYDPVDDFNNSIDYFDFTLQTSTEFLFEISYEITMHETTWDFKNPIGEYDTSDPLYLNLTGEEYNLQVNNPTLIGLSNSICSGKFSVPDKVEAIVDWIIDNIAYEEEAGASQGAYITYFTGRGDCSDYSTLFVTLCRIQGIPARKVIGFVMYDDGQPLYNMDVGDKLTYTYGTEGGFIPGHAWTEYYVPGYGFVSVDPTWAQSDKRKYLNSMDYIHIANSVGENYRGGIDPVLPNSILEFGLTPILLTGSPASVHWELTMDIEVLEAVYKNPNIPFDTAVFMITSVGIITILGMWIELKRKHKKF